MAGATTVVAGSPSPTGASALSHMYTDGEAERLIQGPDPVAALFGVGAFNRDKLRNLVERFLDDEVIKEIANEDRKGRRLLDIATRSLSSLNRARSPTHKSHPDSGGGEFDEREIVGVVFFEARGDRSEMFELVEKALDEISQTIEIGAEDGDVDPPRHRLDVGPSAALCEDLPESVAVVAPVCEQGLARADTVQHIDGAAAVMSLTLAQLERDRVAVGVHHGMDFGRQPSARAPHAFERPMHRVARMSPEAAISVFCGPPF